MSWYAGWSAMNWATYQHWGTTRFPLSRMASRAASISSSPSPAPCQGRIDIGVEQQDLIVLHPVSIRSHPNAKAGSLGLDPGHRSVSDGATPTWIESRRHRRSSWVAIVQGTRQ